MASAESIQVVLTQNKPKPADGAKAPAALHNNQSEVQPAADGSSSKKAAAAGPGCKWSATVMWTLLVLGFVCPPLWWLGVAAGLTSGSDAQCLIKRRKALNKAQAAAWWGHVLMSLVCGIVLILVLAIWAGRKGPEQQGMLGCVCMYVCLCEPCWCWLWAPNSMCAGQVVLSVC